MFRWLLLALAALSSSAMFIPHGVQPDMMVIPHNIPECLVEVQHNGSYCISVEEINDIIQSEIYGGASEEELPYPSKVVLDDRYVFSLANTITTLGRRLKNRYGLSTQAVEMILPLVDTSLTLIGRMCPSIYTPSFSSSCDLTSKYRLINGVCNNYKFPHWGARLSQLKRLIPAKYYDGIDVPTGIYWDGEGQIPYPPLSHMPNPRKVSSIMMVDQNKDDQLITMMLMTFGQLLDHDITATVPSTDDHTADHGLSCCGPKRRPHRDCFPIPVAADDPFYSYHHHTCLNFGRSAPALKYGCRMGPREAINGVTSYIDASLLYGSDHKREQAIREFQHGRLRVFHRFQELNLKPLMPLNTVDPPDVDCIRPSRSHWCFLGGDIRANEQTLLAGIHTLYVRLHNKWAEELQIRNPHWDDEMVYQETRRIIAAGLQHITYNEFLPILLGRTTMVYHGIDLVKEGYYYGYDAHVDASASQGFATGAFRVGHTLLSSKIKRYSPNHQYVDEADLSTHLFRPYDLWKPGYLDTYIAGLLNQECGAFDQSITDEVTKHLFQPIHRHFGEDLVSRNIQRARDHGLPGYTAYRELCGLPPVYSWEGMAHATSNETAFLMSTMYESVHDVDFWVGGVSEPALPDGVVGPTFACVLARQFKDVRDGDRFWYENGGMMSSFTPHQLREIRSISLAAVICDTTDHIDTIQPNPFLLPDYFENQRLPCHLYPRPNLDYWTE